VSLRLRAVPSSPAAALASKAAVLRRLELDVGRKIDGILSGDQVAFGRGPGSEPVSARRYEPGDDARRIDWNLSARTLHPHVRVTEPDRELETWFVVDRSASLDFGTADREKREVVLAALAAFGFAAASGGNRLGVLTAGGDHLERIPPRSGRPTVLAALSALYDMPRRTTRPAPGADLGAALRHLQRICRRRGRVIVVSDFLDETDWLHPLGALARRHDVLAVQVVDRRELEIPAVGMLSVVDPESGRHLHVQTNSARLRSDYAIAAAARSARIRRDIEAASATFLELRTDRDWTRDIASFLQSRRRQRFALRPASPARASS
jgi:uncharacterized protein (DUF58 family)